MKANDQAIEAGVKLCWDCPRATPSMLRDILTAAYAAQFPPSEDYAGLLSDLRIGWATKENNNRAADALEALLAERDTYKNWLDNYEKQFAAKVEELVTIRLERDALLARLAPEDDEALVEIAAQIVASHCGFVCGSSGWDRSAMLEGTRAAVAAIRPHIEAAEREKCAKIIEQMLAIIMFFAAVATYIKILNGS